MVDFGRRNTGASDYLLGLRGKVGHDLLLLPAVSVLIWDNEGRLLLVEQSGSGLWGTVGGMVEPDEAPVDAARREAFEEIGCSVKINRLRSVVGGAPYRVEYPNGDKVAYVSIVYDGHIESGAVNPDGLEISRATWWSLDQLPELHLFGRALLNDLGLAGTTESAFGD